VPAAPATVWVAATVAAASGAAVAALAAVAGTGPAVAPLVQAAPVPVVLAPAGRDRRVLRRGALRARAGELLASGDDSRPGVGYQAAAPDRGGLSAGLRVVADSPVPSIRWGNRWPRLTSGPESGVNLPRRQPILVLRGDHFHGNPILRQPASCGSRPCHPFTAGVDAASQRCSDPGIQGALLMTIHQPGQGYWADCPGLDAAH